MVLSPSLLLFTPEESKPPNAALQLHVGMEESKPPKPPAVGTEECKPPNAALTVGTEECKPPNAAPVVCTIHVYR